MANGYNSKDGTYNDTPVFCPVNGWDCPYYKDGRCCMEDGDPIEDCDEFGYFFESWEEWESL